MLKKQKINQSGFGHVVVILIMLLVVAVIVFVGWRAMGKKKPANSATSPTSTQNSTANESTSTPPTTEVKSENRIVMKSIGFHLDNYDEATNKAGDMVFTKIPLMFDQIWGDFGQQDPRTPNDPTKRNPQPTYILPLGTKVESLVDGTVQEVKQIYSGDYTIMTQATGSDLIFETEHVNNPLVKKGDKVTSGQIIAEVSTHDSQNHAGFGILEIGVLGVQGSRPVHTCPYQYLDASVKDDILKKITNVHDAWEKYLGKDVYPANPELPGCTTTEPFVE